MVQASAGSDRPDLSEMYGYFLDVLCILKCGWPSSSVAALVFLGLIAACGTTWTTAVGYLPFLGRKTDVAINRLAKRYGGVFQMRMGSSGCNQRTELYQEGGWKVEPGGLISTPPNCSGICTARVYKKPR